MALKREPAVKAEHEYGRQIYYNDGECTMGAPEGSPRQLRYEASNKWTRVFKTSEQREKIWVAAEKDITKAMEPVKIPKQAQAKKKRRRKSS